MTIYAKIEDGIVSNIIVSEQAYVDTLADHYVRVTDSTNSVAIGHEYNSVKNKFKAPKPFESWNLNEETLLGISDILAVNFGKFLKVCI